MLQALAIERATATRTAERVLHDHIAQYHSRCPFYAAKGVSGDDAYRLVQRNATKAWRGEGGMKRN